jgi:hypothetical protein
VAVQDEPEDTGLPRVVDRDAFQGELT